VTIAGIDGPRIGVWLLGARGSVATTTIAGHAAVVAGFAPTTGLVTALAPFDGAPLPGLNGLVFGGSDVTDVPLAKRAEALCEAGVLPAGLPDLVAAALEDAEGEIRPGIAEHSDEPPLDALRRLQADITGFGARRSLDGVVVINCATTEPTPPAAPEHERLEDLERALGEGRAVLPPSSLAAYAALELGYPFVDFTPSTGAHLPALAELAALVGVPYAGRDGKTGETLVKSALAAMFADRNLSVRSWSGVNLLGGGDGAALADPARAASKLRTKAQVLEGILGTPVEHHVDIRNVADLGEWKTAWDRISFGGFLGVRMRLEFTWEGADSALAAPLVLDLARLAWAARQAGESGALDALGFFFKEPLGGGGYRLDEQWERLVRWVGDLPTG
jgi:myo-inositol-1-phosphate synthase